MFVAGDWRSAASGETYNTTSPATGAEIGAIPQGDRSDAQAAIAAAAQAADALGPRDGVRARRQDARRRRHHRLPARRARADADARSGQAAAGRGLRRGRRAGRVLARGGRGRQAARRRAAQLVLARQAGAAAAPSARRRRRDQPVELAVHDARRTDRAGARRAATLSSGRRRRRRRCRRSRSPAASPTPTCRPACSTSSPDPAPWSATRSRATPAVGGVGFIGSTGTGRLVAEAAAGKAMVLEMGGNGPIVLLDDGDVDAAVEATRHRVLSVRRPELHRRRADPRAPRRL